MVLVNDMGCLMVLQVLILKLLVCVSKLNETASEITHFWGRGYLRGHSAVNGVATTCTRIELVLLAVTPRLTAKPRQNLG